MKINLLLLMVLLASDASPLIAQELLELNSSQRCIYSGGVMDEELYRFPDNVEVGARI